MYVIWISIELNVIIVISSIPIIRPLLSRNGLALITRTLSARRAQRASIALNNSHSHGGSSSGGGGGDGNSRRRPADQSWHEAISMSKNRSRTVTSSIASEEQLVVRDVEGGKEGLIDEGNGIVRTVEVTTVVSNAEDVALAHAALVGLVL